jgi:O-antigen ligase
MAQTAPFPRQVASTNVFQRVGFYLLLLYLFVMYSRLFDIVLGSFEIPFIITSLVLAASVFSGAFQRALGTPAGKAVLLFTIWMAICLPFSVWRSGSLEVFQGWAKAALSFVYVVGLIDSHRQCLRSVYTIGLAVVVLAAIALKFGSMETGRLFLAEGKFQNPNDLANTLLLGLPFIWLALKNSTQNVLVKIPPIVLAAMVLYTITKTGSRGALVVFLGLMLFVFFSANFVDRMAIAVAGLVLVLIGAFVLPNSLRSRYFTLFEEGEDSRMSESAVTSSEARSELLKRSAMLTVQHPLFGVGPGMFSEANQQDMQAQGIHTADLVSHNSYTTVSSEMGIPGFLLFAGIILISLRLANRVHSLTRRRKSKYWASVTNTASCLRMSLVAYSVTALFATVSYQSTLPTLAGLTVALYITTLRDLASEDSQMIPTGSQAAQRDKHMPMSRSRGMMKNSI